MTDIYSQIKDIPLLSEPEEKTADAQTLIYHNLRLVLSIAGFYKNVSSLPFDDLFQEGTIGLCIAAERYDGSTRFTTFAFPWIKKYILQALNRNHIQYIPLNLGELSTKIKLAQASLLSSLGREPTEEEIAEEIAETPEKVRQVITATQSVSSLDIPIGDDEDTTLGEIIPSSSYPDPYLIFVKEENKETIKQILSTLPSREEEALIMRFGLENDERLSLEAVGEYFSISKERVRQITNNAIRKLRNPARLKLLQDVL